MQASLLDSSINFFLPAKQVNAMVSSQCNGVCKSHKDPSRSMQLGGRDANVYLGWGQLNSDHKRTNVHIKFNNTYILYCGMSHRATESLPSLKKGTA